MSIATIFLCILLLPQLFLIEFLDFMNNPDALIEWFLSGSILIAAVLLLRWRLKDRVPCRARYALWAVVLVRLLLPLQFDLPVAVSSAQLSPEPPAFLETPAFTYTTPAPDPVFPEPQPEPAPLVPETAPTPVPGNDLHIILMEDVILGTWRLGMLLVGGVLVFSNAWFDLRQIRRRRAFEAADSPIPVYVLEGIPSPCLFGPFRPAIYLTPADTADAVRLRHVLAHELTHYTHRDHVWAVLRCLCLTIHWFNPLVWAAVWLSKRDCELACDEGAVRRLGEAERIAYGRTLVDMVAQSGRSGILSCSTTMTDGKKTLQQRIEQLVKHSETKKTALFLAASLLAVAAVFTFAGDEPTAKELGIPTSSEAYLRFTEQLKTDLPLSFDRVTEPYDSFHPATGVSGTRWIKDFLAECHTPLTNPMDAIDADEVPSGTHSLYLYYDHGEGTFGNRYYFISQDGLWYICLEDWDWEEHRWFIPVASLTQGDLSDFERIVKNQKSGDSTYWQDTETGHPHLMSMIQNAHAMAFHDSKSGLYISKTSETYADTMEQAVSLILSEAAPLSEPIGDFLTVQMLRLDVYDKFAALHQGKPNISLFFHPHEGRYYLTLEHDEVYTPVATLSTEAVSQLILLFDHPKTGTDQLSQFKNDLNNLFHVFQYDESVDINRYSFFLSISEQEELDEAKLVLAASCMPWEEGTEVPREHTPNYILLDTDDSTSPAPEYVIESYDSGSFLYRTGERNTPIAAIPNETVTELRKLADPDQTSRLVMGVSILGSGNNRYTLNDPVSIAQLAQLLVSDPETVAQNRHPSYDMTDWLTNWTTRCYVEYGIKFLSRDHTEGWYIQASTAGGSSYFIDVPEHLVEPMKAICERLDNYLTYDIPFNYAQYVHYAPSANSNILVSEIPRKTLLAIDELLGAAVLSDGTESLSVMDADGILDFRLPTESEKLFLFLQEDGDRCLASAVRKIESGSAEHPVTHILPAGTSVVLRAIVETQATIDTPSKVKYTIEDRAQSTRLSEIFLNDPETVALNESPDYDDWLTNWTNAYVIYYGTEYCPAGYEEGWYARAIDAGSWYFIRIPDHLVDEVLLICQQANS